MQDHECKIIFLDIDGVLNRHVWVDFAKSNNIEPSCVAELNRILTVTDARIVLSSAWRYMMIGRQMSLRGFDYLLRTHGVKADMLIGRTHADEEIIGRGLQIEIWRKENEHAGSHVVIDDIDTDKMEKEMLRYHENNLVRTDSKVGLTKEDADKAIEILQRGMK